MDETNKTTVIRNAAWLVAWDEATGGHEYRRDCDLAFRGNSIAHVGPGYEGPADEAIDGERLMVVPGLVFVVLGLAIILYPQILAWLVSLALIVVGLAMLAMVSFMRRIGKRVQK